MASEETVEVSAPSVDEAVIIGLTRLAALRDEVEIEVLDEGNRGFLGLGNREARVRLTRLPEGVHAEPVSRSVEKAPTPEAAPPLSGAGGAPEQVETAVDTAGAAAEAVVQPVASAAVKADSTPETPRRTAPSSRPDARRRSPRRERARQQGGGRTDGGDLDRAATEAVARDVMDHLLPGLNLDVAVEWVDEDRPTLWVAVTGRDANALVGPRARNLQSLQYLFRSLIYKQADGNYNVVVDADGYRRRRRRSLESLAQRKADEAVETGRTVKLRAMPAHERRIIHMLLKQDNRVSTESSGKGRDRAITIVPSGASNRNGS